MGHCGPRTVAEHVAPTIKAAAEAAGRPAPRIVALVGVCVTDDPEGLRVWSRSNSEPYDAFPSYRAVLDREGVASGADLLRTGSIDQIEQGLADYAAAGASDLRISIAAHTEEARLSTREALAARLS